MYENRKNGTADLEEQFRHRCAECGDNAAIMRSEMVFSYIAPLDIGTIRGYGWAEDDLERMMSSACGADEITRLAAWIRECGETDHTAMVEDDPYSVAGPMGCLLDDDGNWTEAM